MRAQLVWIGCVVWLAAPARADTVDETVAEIRALYGRVAPPDESCGGASCLEAETTLRRMLPGTGPHQTHVRFFYAEHLEDEEQIYGVAHLQKAVVRYNIAARTYYVEYLFAGLEPELVFHLQSDEGADRRTWFADGQPIRVDVRSRATEGHHDVRDGGFSAGELEACRAAQARARALVALFDSLVSTADLEMGAAP